MKTSSLDSDIQGMTVAEVCGFGHLRGYTEMCREPEYKEHFVPKLMNVAVATDDALQTTADKIIAPARSGESGDGIIFMTDLSETIQIRTDERGADAV